MRRTHAMPFGADYAEDGTRFALWAPTAEAVTLVLDGEEHDMPDRGEGWRELVRPEARPGSRYQFRINGDLTVPDPASRYQPDDVFGPSEVVDPNAFSWTDAAWRGRPWEETVLWEAHVGTATPPGTFAGLAERLPALKELGVTAIELMPINEFPGRRNWGYDGVLLYAPDGAYGTPDDLRRLVDRAHALGLMVFLDVVYNHFGPSGNFLSAYSKTFFTDRHSTPWGDGINFDGREGVAVREFFVNNALYWLREFHVDGLRFDAVHAIQDDRDPDIVAEIAHRIRAAFPNRYIHLVLENEHNEARRLTRDESGSPTQHTAQWNDDIHHCWHTLLTGERESYYGDFADDPVGRLGRCLAEGFAYQGDVSANLGHARGEPSGHLPPSAFVGFLQNHDQVGNRALGERLSVLTSPERLQLARAGLLLCPQIPLLFMGEEWSATTPFLFFVDFESDEALAKAVREGRRREFQSFAAFGPDGDPDAVPDPTLRETFRNSMLDWSEAERPGHAEVLADTRALLRLRAEAVVPLTTSRFIGASAARHGDLLDVTWRYADGWLRFVANFGAGSAPVPPGETGRAIWRSAAIGAGDAPAELASWTGFFVRGGGPNEL